MEKIHLLFVCMSNICRSPSAEGVFSHLVKERKLSHLFEIDSAGTHAYYIGSPPDRRSQAAAARRGIDISGLRARQVVPQDFEYYHYILAMDWNNYRLLRQAAPPKCINKIHLFLEFAPHLKVDEVPDPYYGGPDGFEYVLDIIDASARGLLYALERVLIKDI